MKNSMPLSTVLFLTTFVVLVGGCGPTCRTIQVDTSRADTLSVQKERIAWVLPHEGNWSVHLSEGDNWFTATNIPPDSIRESGTDIILSVMIHQREPRRNPYKNNTRDYRKLLHKKWKPRPGEGVTTITFIGHICSSLGGWYGFEEWKKEGEVGRPLYPPLPGISA